MREESFNFQNTDNLTFAGAQELFSSENYLHKYNENIVLKILENWDIHLSKDHRTLNIMDFGAGIGTLAEIFTKKTKKKPKCFEIDGELSKLCEARGFNTLFKYSQISEKYDLIYSSNVLEHIEDDKAVIAELSKHLKIGGKLILYVPANQILYSEMDKHLGHYRRYSKRELVSIVVSADMNIRRVDYVDSLGFLAALLMKIIGYKKVGNVGGDQSLIFYDKYIFPLSKLCDFIGFRKIIGKNIFLVAEKLDKSV